MPRGVVYDTFTEAQEYADRVNGEPMEVEGGFSVVNPLGYSDGGKVVKPIPIRPPDKLPPSPTTEDIMKFIRNPKGFKGTF